MKSFLILIVLLGLYGEVSCRYKSRHFHSRQSKKFSNVERVFHGTDIVNPNAPDTKYNDAIEDPSVGIVVSIELYIHERLDIFFHAKKTQASKEVIPLHISIRPNEDAIVFNSLIRDKWDHEERRRLPFEIQSLVLIDVKFDYTGFLVTINDEWLKMYEYRYPVTSANFLTIKGDCSMRSVSIFEEKGEETIKAAEYQQQETEETEKEALTRDMYWLHQSCSHSRSFASNPYLE
ncbi:hypothetical protein GCK72_013805 [Caenorhabditis remanei]|uniref:Galectin n=1 Tax=Caenorhabditis remanei TaxID=31234 RepID=A0A6A5GPP4_CAERE|nr:hypothetical protein GCK72_013805 [Caenorhabditis remanei]KAF1757350.1 hypothetical protein GCK72_013805 [Caenorhabditis remanei]